MKTLRLFLGWGLILIPSLIILFITKHVDPAWRNQNILIIPAGVVCIIIGVWILQPKRSPNSNKT